ncbi:MAG: glucan biosynthesis protein, partial [Geminicoccales bacterium]
MTHLLKQAMPQRRAGRVAHAGLAPVNEAPSGRQRSAIRSPFAMFDRRQLLIATSALALLSPAGRRLNSALAAGAEIPFGPARPFDFDWLQEQARQLAAQPYQDPVIRFGDVLETVDYDVYQQIRFKPEMALWADGSAPFPVQLFHLGRYFKAP